MPQSMTAAAPLISALAALVGFVLTIMLARFIVAASLGPMARAFPPVMPRPEGVTRKAQSFSIGLVSLGVCVNVTADAERLHLRPGRLGLLVSMPAMSIPWSAIEPARARPGARWINAKVRGPDKAWTVRGPSWCLRLADPGHPHEPTTT